MSHVMRWMSLLPPLLGKVRRRASPALLALVLGFSGCVTSSQRAADADLQARRATSHLNLGADHLKSGRGAMALRELLTAESLDPKNPRMKYALGEAYLAQQKPDLAEQNFRKALELHPAHHDSRLSLSALYIVQGRYDEAIVECETLIDDPTFPAPWRALSNLGWSEYRLGRTPEARRSLQLARDYRASYWPAMLSLAVIESDAGNRLDSIGLLQEVIELGPGPRVEAEANYRLAENYIALGKRSRAVGYLTTAVARAPEGEWARRSEEYLKLLR